MIRNILIIITLIVGIFAIEYFSSQSSSLGVPVVQTGSQISQMGGVSQVADAVKSRVARILRDSEVIETLDRIDRIKPRYQQDNAVFMNREKNLQVQSDVSYYREWTVETPGSRDRGPRRIIIGSGGEIYFTDDHYRSFVRIH